MQTVLKKWNLSVQEFTALSVLSHRPGLSNAQLSRRALVTPQTMIELLAKLEERGLIQRVVDPAHARILRAELTDAGAELLVKTDPEIRRIQDQMLTSVPASDRAAAMRAMRTAMANLSSHAE